MSRTLTAAFALILAMLGGCIDPEDDDTDTGEGAPADDVEVFACVLHCGDVEYCLDIDDRKDCEDTIGGEMTGQEGYDICTIEEAQAGAVYGAVTMGESCN